MPEADRGGFAYAAEGNVWFNVAKDADYGKLSNRRWRSGQAGTRTLEGRGKETGGFRVVEGGQAGRAGVGFALGKGPAGMAYRMLRHEHEVSRRNFRYPRRGNGSDVPHHENELAQSESATGKPFAKYWLHNGLTRIKTKLAGGRICR